MRLLSFGIGVNVIGAVFVDRFTDAINCPPREFRNLSFGISLRNPGNSSLLGVSLPGGGYWNPELWFRGFSTESGKCLPC